MITEKLRQTTTEACDSRPATTLEERPLLSSADAVKVMALFKVLANDTRLRLLHHLIRRKETNVTDIVRTLGMKPPAVSNQLLRLSDMGIVDSRREGTNIYYRLVSSCVPPFLDLALQVMDGEGLPSSTAAQE